MQSMVDGDVTDPEQIGSRTVTEKETSKEKRFVEAIIAIIYINTSQAHCIIITMGRGRGVVRCVVVAGQYTVFHTTINKPIKLISETSF